MRIKPENKIKKFEFYDLPKVSLNDFYKGGHWSKRKKIKDAYKLIISSITKETIDFPCDVEYEFWFKSRPLDCSNACGGMVKLIEDCLFVDDSYKMVRSIKISSKKRNDDVVFIKVIPA
jgi:hypothetical protein